MYDEIADWIMSLPGYLLKSIKVATAASRIKMASDFRNLYELIHRMETNAQMLDDAFAEFQRNVMDGKVARPFAHSPEFDIGEIMGWQRCELERLKIVLPKVETAADIYGDETAKKLWQFFGGKSLFIEELCWALESSSNESISLPRSFKVHAMHGDVHVDIGTTVSFSLENDRAAMAKHIEKLRSELRYFDSIGKLKQARKEIAQINRDYFHDVVVFD